MGISVYLKELENTLHVQKKLLGCLEAKVGFNESKLSSLLLDGEQKNEAEIVIIKTNAEIETLKKTIAEKEKYFHNYAKHFEKDLNDADANWDDVIKKARAEVQKKPMIQPYLDAVDNVELDVLNDLDKKVFIFKRVKALLNG